MRLFWVLLTSQALIAPLVSGFNKPQIRVTTTFKDFNARIMDQWGGGGGRWVKVSPGNLFAGRNFGGGKRKEIRGTRAFGSGYPYGANNQSTLSGRPFPFGVWPLYWDQNFMDADEYGPEHDGARPGGFIAYVPLRTTKEHFNVTGDEVYYAIGDRESLLPLMVSYVTSCHVTPVWPSRLDPSTSNATVKPENVIQYFRGSSFALSSPAYNNTFARTINSEMNSSTPIPEFMEYSPFRKCIDSVTENALAIVNQIPRKTPLDNFVIAVTIYGLFVCVAMAFVAIIVCGILLILILAARQTFQDWIYGAPPLHSVKQEREVEMQYESYP